MGCWAGIELVLGTRVKAADVRARTLLTAAGETISYKILVIATGARVYALIPLLGPTGAALGFRLMENGCVQFGIKRTHVIVLLWQS